MEPGTSSAQSKKDKQKEACQALRKIWSFLENYLPLANTHGADFITQGHWEQHVPETWRRELVSLSRQQLVLLSQYPGLEPGSTTPGTRDRAQQPPPTSHDDDARARDVDNHLSSFIAAAGRCHLESISTLSTLSDALDFTQWIHVSKNENDHLSEGMSEKKSHEIEAVSAAVMSLITRSQAHVIIDVGSGKGYLGCELSLRQKIPVIGLDSCDTNTQGALMRDGKLTRRWQQLARRRQTPHNTTNMPDCSQTGLLSHQISNEVSCPSNTTSYSRTHQKLSGSESWVTVEASPADLPSLEGNACANCYLRLSTASLEDTQSTLAQGPGQLGNSCTASKTLCTSCGGKTLLNGSCGGTLTNGSCRETSSCSCSFTDNKESRHECSHSQQGTVQGNVDMSSHSRRQETAHGNVDMSSHSHRQQETAQGNVDMSSHSHRQQETAQGNVDMSSHSHRQQETVQGNVDMSSHSRRQQEAAQGNVEMSSHSHRQVVSPVIPAPIDAQTDQKPQTTVTPGRSLYVPLTLAVHPDMNLTQILEAHAWKVGITEPASARILCTGLHACGSLSVTAMRLFIRNPAVVGLCVVGCCYQLMEESCPEAAGEGLAQSAEAHFPLSQVGQQLGLHLGRNARNLASQSVDRMQASGQLQGADFCWRAMLELLLQELKVAVPQRIVGMRKLHKRCHSFLEYVRAAVSKLHLHPDLASPELVASVEARCGEIGDKLAALVQLKLLLAPVIEAVVLLDRYLYLLEQDYIQDAHIVRLFDPMISPRCYGIIAWKSQS